MNAGKQIAIFDLCGVLIDWSPRYAYELEITDKKRLDYFLSFVCNEDFIRFFSEGKTIAEAVNLWIAKFPDYEKEISLYPLIRTKMLKSEIEGSIDIAKKLKNKGIKLYILSNCSYEDSLMVNSMFKSLDLFDGYLFSGVAKVAKPKSEIFYALFDKYNIDPKKAVFIDDRAENVAKAREIGLDAVLFTNPKKLESDLKTFGLL